MHHLYAPWNVPPPNICGWELKGSASKDVIMLLVAVYEEHLNIWTYSVTHAIYIHIYKKIANQLSTKNKKCTANQTKTHPVKVELLFSHPNSLVVCTKEQAPEQEELLASLDLFFNGGFGDGKIGRGLCFQKREWNKESGCFFSHFFLFSPRNLGKIPNFDSYFSHKVETTNQKC